MLFLSQKAEKDQELRVEELQQKKEQHDLDAKRLPVQASIDQQRQFRQQQSEMMRLMEEQQQQQQQQQQQLLASQQLMLRQQQDQTKALMSLLDKFVNKLSPNSLKVHQYCWYNCRLILNCAITNQFVYFINFCPCFDKSHDQRFLSAIKVCISTVAPHFSCAEEPAFRYFV